MSRRTVSVVFLGFCLLGNALPAAAAVIIDKLIARAIPARSTKGYPQEFEFEITIRDRGVTRILGCDLAIDFGDGTPPVQQHFMDGGARRTVLKHLYDMPGSYSVTARGRAIPGVRACELEKSVQITVGSPPAEGEALGVGCPAGWSLIPGSQSGYRFKCRPEPGTPKIECQGGTKYVEQDGAIGCQ